MTTHLRKLGHEVVVITSSPAGVSQAEGGVVRTRDVLTIKTVRKLLRSPPLPGPGDPPPGHSPRKIRHGIVVPDPQLVSWAPGAFVAAQRILRRREFDCMITTSPFESTHLVGLALGARRPPWVADLRDGWTFDPWRPDPPLFVQRTIDARLEREVLVRADAVSALPLAVAADVRSRFGRAAHHVPGGWDPELEADVARARPPLVDPERVTLVYTGTLWKNPRQDPAPLFAALRRLQTDDPDLCGRLELVIAGPLSTTEAERLAQFRIGRTLRHVGHLSRLEAVALQRRADALVLVASRERDVVTGKLFEYLVAGRPILALTNRDEAAAIVDETGTGVAVALDDEPAIVQGLRDVISGELMERYRPRGLSAYTFPAPAIAMLDVIQTAIADSTTRR